MSVPRIRGQPTLIGGSGGLRFTDGTKMNKERWTWTTERVIPSCPQEGHRLILEIVDQLHQHRWRQRDIFAVHLALEEALVNAIKHGNGEDVEKKVQLQCKISPHRCWIQIEDEGRGFDPDRVPDCTLNENLDKPSGRGLKLMRNFMSWVEYNKRGNRVAMEKVLRRMKLPTARMAPGRPGCRDYLVVRGPLAIRGSRFRRPVPPSR